MSGQPPGAMRRRLIVELCHGGADPDTLRTLAEFAASLGFDLHGLFIEDEALLGLAELPFARELRLPTHQWQPLHTEQLAGELRHAAAEAHRLLHETATTFGVPIAFEVLRGDPAAIVAAHASRRDVVVIADPNSAGAMTTTLSALHDALRASTASMLLLPARFAARRGPVVALLAHADDAALALAARAAANTRQHLLLLLPTDDAAMRECAVQQAVAAGMVRSQIASRVVTDPDADSMLHALGHEHASLLVLSRDATPAGRVQAASRIAGERGVPVLLVEPLQTIDLGQGAVP